MLGDIEQARVRFFFRQMSFSISEILALFSRIFQQDCSLFRKRCQYPISPLLGRGFNRHLASSSRAHRIWVDVLGQVDGLFSSRQMIVFEDNLFRVLALHL